MGKTRMLKISTGPVLLGIGLLLVVSGRLALELAHAEWEPYLYLAATISFVGGVYAQVRMLSQQSAARSRLLEAERRNKEAQLRDLFNEGRSKMDKEAGDIDRSI
jgi:hypothetical protein